MLKQEKRLSLQSKPKVYETEEAYSYAKLFYSTGVISRTIHCYERILYKGELSRISYLRLIILYKCKNDTINAKRLQDRYKKIFTN